MRADQNGHAKGGLSSTRSRQGGRTSASVEGDKVTIRRGNRIDKGKGMTNEVFWRLMALWEGNERDGAAFAEAACACLDTLQPGAVRTGRSARKEEMCWATPRNLLWIFVEELL